MDIKIFNLLFLPAIISFAISLLVTYLVIRYAKKLGILDTPGKRGDPATLHTKPIPRGGGIPIFLSILITSIIFLPLDSRAIGIFFGAGIVAFIGFLDDRNNANPYLRLLGQFLAAGVVFLLPQTL